MEAGNRQADADIDLKAEEKPRQFKSTVRYVYAISDDAVERNYGKIGIDGANVYTIPQGALAVVVSDTLNKKIRPERRKLTAHHEVIAKLMAKHTVLPAAFGTISGNTNSLLNMLKKNQTLFGQQLKRVNGKVEMGLNVVWNVHNISEYFVNRYPELEESRDDMLARKRGPTRDQKIDLGRLFEQLLNQEREVHTKAVMRVLSRHCAEIKQNKPRQDREVMRLACLVDRSGQEKFEEEGILLATKLFDDNYTFKFSGPWSPYNFVTGLKINI
jgi:hypothetical protein